MRLRKRSLPDNKYAQPEYERRFLLKEAPPGLDENKLARIVDYYLPRTRMRLRRIERRGEDTVEYKLGLKFADASLPEGCVAMTNLYLNENEYDYLRPFVGTDSIVKRRYPFVRDAIQYGVDVFEGPLAGLVLAEAGFDTADEYRNCPTPDFAVADVTTNGFFTGGELSKVGETAFKRVLSAMLGTVSGIVS